MPLISAANDFDRKEREDASFAREQAMIHADKEPSSDGSEYAATLADKLAAEKKINELHQVVQSWVVEVWNLELYAMRCFDTAREIERRIWPSNPQPIDTERNSLVERWIAFGNEHRREKAAYKLRAEEARAVLLAAGGKYRLPWEEWA